MSLALWYTRSVSGPGQIDGKDIANWADTSPNADAVLHQLVRRLLWASARLRRLDMSAGTAKHLGGWDGVCEAMYASAHCPIGTSGWELSKQADVKSKLDKDYEKRSKNPHPLVPARSSYVAVSARRYPKKLDWAAKRNDEGIWAEVRVLDADDLAQWLEECPAVATWFARTQLQRPSYELSSVEQFLADWSAETEDELRLPPRFLLLGRDHARSELLRWSAQPRPTSLLIQATSKREAQLFAAATFDALDEGQRAEMLARTVIVETPSAWRWAAKLETERPLILIPAFAEFEPELGRGRHFVVVPTDGEIAVTTSGVSIAEPQPWRGFGDALVELGLPPRRAEQLAERSGGRLRALQLELGATETRPPAWVTRESHEELIAMLMLGAWEPEHAGDVAAVRRLGVDPDALERLCARLTSVEGAPIRRDGDGDGYWRAGIAYRWSYDVWARFAPELSKRTLERFCELATEVLTDDDPMYLRPAAERMFAPVMGDTPTYSRTLHRAIASSVLELSRLDALLLPRLGASFGSRIAERIVHAVLEPWWVRWASVGRELLLLAEAAPRVFLDRLHASLADDDGVAQMFVEEGESVMHGSTPHTPLLWALEVLCWDLESMPLAVEQLMVLAERDPPDERSVPRVGNRPLTSLAAVFNTMTPQTLVEDEARFEVLAALVERHPARGFELLLSLVHQLSGRVLPQSAKPKRDERIPTEPSMPTRGLAGERGRRCFELALTLANHEPGRWARLIDTPINQLLGDGMGQALVERLIELRDSFSDEDCLPICDVARRELSGLYATSLHEKLDGRRQQLHQLLDVFAPDSPVLRWAWLFEPGQVLLEPHEDLGFRETQARIDPDRDRALERLLATETPLERLSELVVYLVDQGSDLSEAARALARREDSEEWDARLLRAKPPGKLQPLAAPFAFGRYVQLGSQHEWLARLMREWLATQREDDALATLRLHWPEPKIWDLLDELGEPLRSRYWRGITGMLPNHDEEQWERAVENLLEVGNAAGALSTAGYRSPKLPSKLLIRVLENFCDRLQQSDDVRLNRYLVHAIETIFRQFDRRDDDGELDEQLTGQIVSLELVFIGLFTEGRRSPRFVWRVLAQNPRQFVDLLRLVYRAEGQPAEEEPSEERKRLAENAYTIMEAWRSYPGAELDDTTARDQRLHDWAVTVLELAEQSGHGKIAQHEVAKVLARPEHGPDGHWPSEAARRLLQSADYPELSRALRTAKHNLRGVWTRSLDEGGEQERDFAATFKRSADAMRTTWPETALMLDELAASYLAEAEGEDLSAHERRIRGGYMPAPAPESEPIPSTPSTREPPDSSTTVLDRLPDLALSSIGPAASLELDFAPRLTLLTGDNSLGKTFLLDVTWWALSGEWINPDRVAQPSEAQRDHSPTISLARDGEVLARSAFDRASERWPRGAAWPQTSSPVIYARVDDGFSVWDPLRNDANAELPAFHFDERQLWDGLPGPGRVVACRGLLTDWHDWSKDPDHRAFSALRSVLAALSEPDISVEPAGSTKLKSRGAQPIPKLRFPYGEVPLIHVSAGWRRILGLAYLLVWTWLEHRDEARRRGSPASRNLVVLLDEAEAHLHPRWQRVILPALLGAVEALESELSVQLVAVTHSPMVTASIEPRFEVERDRVYHLELDDDQQVRLEPFAWARYTDASSWLESPLFGLERATSPEAERALRAAHDFVRGKLDELPPELATRDKIHDALRRSLAESDPFWLRWMVFNEIEVSA